MSPLPCFPSDSPETEAFSVEGSGDPVRALAAEVFRRVAYRHPASWIDTLARIARRDPSRGATPTERDAFMAGLLLRNASVAREGWPLCQDTGVAGAFAWIGNGAPTGPAIARGIALGAGDAWSSERLRESVLEPLPGGGERATCGNLPVDLDARPAPIEGAAFLFHVKGGGSSNRTSFRVFPPSVLSSGGLESFLREAIPALGVAACPPYRLVLVAGGESPEANLRALKLATLGALAVDRALGPTPECGAAIRVPELEALALDLARDSGLGAQFGGVAMATEAEVWRLPRHAASVFVSLGVACCARRHAWAFLGADGTARIERLGEVPPEAVRERPTWTGAVRADFSAPFGETLAALRRLDAGAAVLLSGPVLVARDAAHARIVDEMRSSGDIPAWARDIPFFYAGPTEAAPGRVSGSFGPTTASRMDHWLPALAARGASLVSIAKGERGDAARRACAEFGAVYLATAGGVAALFGRDHVRSSRIVAYPELGMEAVRLVELVDLPAIVSVDARGGDALDANRR